MKFKGNTISIVNFELRRTVNFLEYVFGGCDINLSIAIDFTASNGPPNQSDSLHYMGNMQGNQYYNALSSVGNILQYYDSDKEIPLYGFGASINPVANRASHCFALNGNIFEPECNGLEGVLDSYKNAI
jgi:hypothetical protein